MQIDPHTDPSSVDIADLLPQKKPFLMVDRLCEYTPKRSITDFVVTAENPFVSEGVFREGGVIENAAQSCAAHNGWRNFLEGLPVRLGAVGVVRNFDFHSLPVAGDNITTEIEVLEFVFDVILMKATVRSGEKLIAEGEMKLSLL